MKAQSSNQLTIMAKPATVQREWYLIDAKDQVVGRLAVLIADIIRGKHRPDYTPHIDTGDFVVVINAQHVRFTGNKWMQKVYQRYSHYAGGLKEIVAQDMHRRHPTHALHEAVRRMVPRNRLGRQQMTKLKIYAGDQHPHQAQQPIALPPALLARLEK